jgi:prepilin-type N-terminal cleavage/methylation domain-containing protein
MPLAKAHITPRPRAHLASKAGYTLIETLIAMVLGLIVCGIAYSLLNFTVNDVGRISERATVDQTAIHTMERLMLQLHSACVTPEYAPVRSESTASVLRFVSESGTAASLEPIELHEVIYTAPSGTFKGSLTEKSWTSHGTAPNFTFNETETPTSLTLLKGVEQTSTTPVFQYYRYYRPSDSNPVYGTINPTPLAVLPLTEAEAKLVTDVRVAFTATPEVRETTSPTTSNAYKQDRPVPLEDSVVFRLSPASESSTVTNTPCS